MTEVPKDSSGVPDGTQAGNDGKPEPTPAGSGNVEALERNNKKLLTELKNLRTKFDEVSSAQEQAKLAKLEEEGKLQEQLDFYKTKHSETLGQVEELNSKLTGEQEKWNTAKKVAAFKGALPGQLGSQYTGLIPVESILVDPESGQPDPASVQKAVDDFQKQFPEVIVRGNAPRSPNEFPQGTSANTAQITRDQWKAMSPEERAKNKDAYLAAVRQQQH